MRWSLFSFTPRPLLFLPYSFTPRHSCTAPAFNSFDIYFQKKSLRLVITVDF